MRQAPVRRSHGAQVAGAGRAVPSHRRSTGVARQGIAVLAMICGLEAFRPYRGVVIGHGSRMPDGERGIGRLSSSRAVVVGLGITATSGQRMPIVCGGQGMAWPDRARRASLVAVVPSGTLALAIPNLLACVARPTMLGRRLAPALVRQEPYQATVGKGASHHVRNGRRKLIDPQLSRGIKVGLRSRSKSTRLPMTYCLAVRIDSRSRSFYLRRRCPRAATSAGAGRRKRPARRLLRASGHYLSTGASHRIVYPRAGVRARRGERTLNESRRPAGSGA